jgi:hypothetical protein
MALGVCLLFDDRTDRALRALWARLEELGVPTLHSHTHRLHHPHLSYVVLLQWDLDLVRAAVEALPDRGPFEVTFHAIAAFRRGRAWLAPGVTSGMALRQEAVEATVRATGALIHEHYEAGTWVPHCSLAPRVRLDQLGIVAAAVYDVLPLTGRVARAALIDSASGRMWPLRGIP